MTYREAIEYLYGIRLFGQKLGLETMRELLRSLGDPQDGLRFLHIAGTNGKGSVAAMCHSVLAAAGYRTGLYTSPHLVSFCERFQIGGQPIAEADVVRLVEKIRPLIEPADAAAGRRAATFFEAVTAIALDYFRAQNVDVVVWETGLGGRLDATNVVTPLVSVITNIAFDHTQYLGDTLGQIAYEKCGIIKPQAPVVTAARDAEVLAVIRQASAQNASPLTIIGETIQAQRCAEISGGQQVRLVGTRQHDGVVEIPLLGAHQAVNCATAVAALEAAGLAVAPQALRDGLRRTQWPGRFQIVRERPTIVLDGAHNRAGVETLAATLAEYFAGRPVSLIVGILRDKNYEPMCARLAPLAQRIWCVPVNSERRCDPNILARQCHAANPAADVQVAANVADALALARARAEDVVVITGSLFLVGEALAQFRPPFGRAAASTTELILQ